MCEPETILQPSLHTMPEYIDIMLGEAEGRGVDVTSQRAEFDARADDEWINEIGHEVLMELYEAGYENAEESDTLLIMPKGVPLPPDWRESGGLESQKGDKVTAVKAKAALEIARKATAETLAAYTAADTTAKVAREAANQASRVARAAVVEEYAAVAAYHVAVAAAAAAYDTATEAVKA